MASKQPTGLSEPSGLHSTTKPQSFTTNVLVVGGSYAGLSAIKSFVLQARARFPKGYKRQHPVNVTLIEPRCGLLNVIGIPRAVVDPEFAPTQYVAYDKLHDLEFDATVSRDQLLVRRMSERGNDDLEGHRPNEYYGLNVSYVQGRVTELKENSADYVLVGEHTDLEPASIAFDYVVMASGRDRSWPTTPKAYTMDHYRREMATARDKFAQHDIITVIGGGAVGVEMAGDIKHCFQDKTVRLIHPHSLFPPEPLHDEFKKSVHDSLERSGVEVRTNLRIARQTDSGDLVTTDGETIKSSYNLWCNYHKNNVGILTEELRKVFVTAANNITVNNYLQLFHELSGRTVPHFFVLGDLVDLPIIKSAGWAMYMGRQVANNIMSLVYEGTLVEPLPDLSTIPYGMVVVAGNQDIVSELAGEVELNHSGYVQEYKDYCVGKVRATMQV